MSSDAGHSTATDARAAGSNGSDATPPRSGHDAASHRSTRLNLIDPVHWPTNSIGVLALFDDMADCFRLAPPHDYDTDEVPYNLILAKGKGKGKGSEPRLPAAAPSVPDLLPKGERTVKEPTA